MEEISAKENKTFKTAGVIMRLALLFGTAYEFLIITTFLGAPFFIWKLVGGNNFEYSNLFILVIVLTSLFIYIPYIFISHRMVGKTFGQANLKA